MRRGIPFRRGYFLHGPPKCGKTHFVKLLARHLGATLHVVDLRDKSLNDQDLINMYQGYSNGSGGGGGMFGNGGSGAKAAGAYSIVLFKGIEDAVQYRSMLNRNLTYTTLLNVLDGPFAATNGVINIITCSNFAHFKEDTTSVDALLRPGRIAKQVEFTDACMLEDMFVMMLGTR